MGGVALGKLWDTHPRLACALQILASIFIAFALAVSVLIRRDWAVIVVLAAGLVLEVASLVFFTRQAIAHGWSRTTW